MKVFITSLLFLVSSFLVHAQQQIYFIYLQTENKQPFFVKINEKVLSSSPLGYLIIPKLENGMYTLVVGFPQSTYQQEFNCSIKNKDVGFILKNTGEKQWVLFNLQTQATLVPGEVRNQKIVDFVEKQNDPFSTMLANAVNDSSILEKDITTVIELPGLNKDTAAVAMNVDTTISKSIQISSADSLTQKDVAKETIPPVNLINDSTKIVAINTDTSIAKLPIISTDSLSQKDIGNEAVPQVNLNNDTTKIVAINTDTSLIKPQVISSDSLSQKNLVQQTNTEKANVQLPADTLHTSLSDNNVSPTKKKKKNIESLDPVVVQKDVAKDPVVAINQNETKTDTLQINTSDNAENGTTAKQKIKKKKKNVESTDSLLVQKEVTKEKDLVIKSESKTDTSQNNLSDNGITKSAAKQKIKKKKKSTELIDSTVHQDVVKDVATVTDKVEKKSDSPPFINFKDEAVITRSTVKRKAKKSTREGLEMMYVDDDGETKDTIRLLIPVDKRKKQEDELLNNANPPNVTPAQSEIKPETQVKETNKEPVSKLTMINSDCKSFATDDDFLKIRKKMVAENSDDDMVKAAKKTLKSKCFTTEQIKNLSVLFLKDEGKYMFFDAAYPYVSDSELYSTLQSQLTDNYYITRFKAMIHK